MIAKRIPPACRPQAASSLVELMIATVILVVILALILSITQQTGDAWKNSAAKIEVFQGARAAFESMTRRLSQATLNTSYDYFDNQGQSRTASNAATFTPARYGRHSDLHFISGPNLLNGQITHSVFFQAATGYSDDLNYKELDSALNECGYYIEYGRDSTRPPFLSTLNRPPPDRYRFRLMQFVQPTENLEVYKYDPRVTSSDPRAWFTVPLSSSTPPVRLVTENVVALIILPKRSEKDAVANQSSLAPAFEYDSRPARPPVIPQPPTENQLPPLVQVVMVAVDEPSFTRFGNPSTAPDFGCDQLFLNASHLDSDLNTLTNVLSANPSNLTGNKVKLRYQIFRSDVPIRSAKWSE